MPTPHGNERGVPQMAGGYQSGPGATPRSLPPSTADAGDREFSDLFGGPSTGALGFRFSPDRNRSGWQVNDANRGI